MYIQMAPIPKKLFFSFLYFPLKQIGYDFVFYSFQYSVLFIFINLLMTPDLHPTHYTPGAGNLALDLWAPPTAFAGKREKPHFPDL